MMNGVIVADNDFLMRGILRSMLVGVGQTVFLASCGEEAVAFGTRLQARLVLLDLAMPRTNGLVACTQLRRLPGYAATPIVILTALEDAEARRAAVHVGATLFFTKPFRPASLLQALVPYLGLDPLTQETVARAAHRAQEIAAYDPDPASTWLQPSGAAPPRPSQAMEHGRSILDVYRP